MMRLLSAGLLAAALCAVESGCCCCRLPFAIRGGGPAFVVNPPPVVVNPPPVNPNPNPNPPPFNPNPNPQPANKKPVTVKYQYYVNTGQFKADGKVIATGFSGKGEAKNDPESYMENIVGAIQFGEWKVERRRTDANGEPIFDVKLFTGQPNARTAGEKFTIHPDNAPNAGESGIALPRNARDMIQIPKGVFDLCIIEVRKDDNAPPRAKTYTYSQSTGKLTFYSKLVGKGYSGKGAGRNNAAMQETKDVGPIPAGEYEMIMKEADRDSVGFGSKIKLNPMGKFTKRWPAEDIWLATESLKRGSHPAIFIVMPVRNVVDSIEFRANNPRTRLKVVP